jgi:hypothetical protein
MIRNSEKIQGFAIPTLDKHLVVNLFADDMVIYVNDKDRYDNLQEILDNGAECQAQNLTKKRLK